MNPRLPYVASLSAVMIMLAVSMSELSFDWFYLSIRALTIILTLLTVPALKRNPFSVSANTFAVFAILSNLVWGELHRPFYIFSYFQLSLLAAFLFYLPRWAYQVLIYGALAAFVGVQVYLRSQGRGWYLGVSMTDFVLLLSIFAVIFDLIHRFFVSERIFREKATQRFAAIGKNQALIIHHLKGLMSAPSLYLDLLQTRVNETADPELEQLVKALHLDMERLNRGILELNQLTAMKINETETFSIEHCVQQVREIMGRKLEKVEIDVHPRGATLCSEKSVFISVLMNAFLNSYQAWNLCPFEGENLKLDIVLEKRKLKIIDNGKGFNTAVLRRLNRNEFRSDREGGSGIGSLLIETGASHIGGTARFYNRRNGRGAVVQIDLPKGVVVGSV